MQVWYRFMDRVKRLLMKDVGSIFGPEPEYTHGIIVIQLSGTQVPDHLFAIACRLKEHENNPEMAFKAVADYLQSSATSLIVKACNQFSIHYSQDKADLDYAYWFDYLQQNTRQPVVSVGSVTPSVDRFDWPTEHAVITFNFSIEGTLPEIETDLTNYFSLCEALVALKNRLYHYDDLLQVHVSPLHGDTLKEDQIIQVWPDLFELSNSVPTKVAAF